MTIEWLGQDEDGNTVWYAPMEGTDSRAGTVLTYEYSKKSENAYDALIPLTALHEANGMRYILTAEVRSGILGDSYTAVKTAVTVLETDDTNAAVQSGLSGDVLIITESNKYVKEGDRVRLSE